MKTIIENEQNKKLEEFRDFPHLGIMKRWNENSSHPHILAHGPYGVGKSATIRAMLKAYYDKNLNYNTVWSDASKKSERSIAYIESLINKMRVKSLGNYPYRVFIFEEADQLTGDAEKALKDGMVRHSQLAKMIFVTNYPNKINGAIKSRCRAGTLQYKLMNQDILKEYIGELYDKYAPKFKYEGKSRDEMLDSIFTGVPLATRDAIGDLEFVLSGGKIDTSRRIVRDLSTSIMTKFIQSMNEPISKSRLLNSTVGMYDDILSAVGNYERDMLTYMFNVVKVNWEDKPLKLGYCAMEMATTDVNLQNTDNPSIHIMALFTKFTKKFGRAKK